MSQSEPILITGKDGLRGSIIGPSATSDRQVMIMLENGRQIQVPGETLVRQADGSYYLPLGLAELQSASASTENDGRIVVPVMAEELNVQKRQVTTGGVRVRKLVHEHQETVDEPLLREDVQVERVPVNLMVSEPVQVRYEGETMIIPILEEVLVVEKRLMVKEEVRVTKRQTQHNEPQEVTVRSEEVVVEPLTPSSGYAGSEGLAQGAGPSGTSY